MHFLLETDQEWLLQLNSLHAAWLDPIVFFLTKTWVWTPLYLILIALSIKNYKQKSWIVFIGIAITILFADQVTSSFMKPFFARLRPSHEPALEGLLHLVNNYRGGPYGFASGHAANTFGTALFFWLILHEHYRYAWLLFVWASVMTYTRIYLGVHYPGDILAGMLVGALGATLGYQAVIFLRRRLPRKDLPENSIS